METITTINLHGKKHRVTKVLGDGCYTVAYRLRSGNVLCVTNNDPAKDALVRSQKFQNPHIPKIRRISSDGYTKSYRMPEYTPVCDMPDSFDTPAAQQARKLADFYCAEWQYAQGENDIERCNHLIDRLVMQNIVDDSVVEAIRLLLKTVANDDYFVNLDMHDGNIATTSNGDTLILLDIFLIN